MPRNQLSKFDKDLRKIISQNLKKYTHHLTQVQLSEMTGIPKSTLSGYFAMRSTPNAGAVEKIANVLHLKKSDIDPRFSLHISKQPSSLQAAQHSPDAHVAALSMLTPKEQEIIQKYRSLSPEGQTLIDASLNALYKTTIQE